MIGFHVYVFMGFHGTWVRCTRSDLVWTDAIAASFSTTCRFAIRFFRWSASTRFRTKYERAPKSPNLTNFFTSFFHSSFFVPLSNSFELHLSNTMHNDQLKSTGARNNSQPCENPCSTWKWHCLNHVQLQSSIFNVYIRVESEWQKEIA